MSGIVGTRRPSNSDAIQASGHFNADSHQLELQLSVGRSDRVLKPAAVKAFVVLRDLSVKLVPNFVIVGFAYIYPPVLLSDVTSHEAAGYKPHGRV